MGLAPDRHVLDLQGRGRRVQTVLRVSMDRVHHVLGRLDLTDPVPDLHALDHRASMDRDRRVPDHPDLMGPVRDRQDPDHRVPGHPGRDRRDQDRPVGDLVPDRLEADRLVKAGK